MRGFTLVSVRRLLPGCLQFSRSLIGRAPLAGLVRYGKGDGPMDLSTRTDLLLGIRGSTFLTITILHLIKFFQFVLFSFSLGFRFIIEADLDVIDSKLPKRSKMSPHQGDEKKEEPTSAGSQTTEATGKGNFFF